MIRYVTDHSRGHANISEIEQDDAQPAGTWRSHIVAISGTGPLSVNKSNHRRTSSTNGPNGRAVVNDSAFKSSVARENFKPQNIVATPSDKPRFAVH